MQTEVKTVKFILTFFWSFLLVQMGAYVLSSMQGFAYNFTTATILAAIVSVIVIAIAKVIPNEPVEEHHH